MSKEKETDFVEFKFRDLKVYASTEWLADGKKKYQQVFEKAITGYIYAEFSFFNKLFDEKEWEVKVQLKCHELDDKFNKTREVCTINVGKKVAPTENIVYFREGWGNPNKGAFWKRGRYAYEAFIDGKLVGTRNFYVEEDGKVTPENNPYFKITGLKLFEGTNKLPPKPERKYYTAYNAKEARYIWAQLEIENKLPTKSWYCEAIFNFYNDARQLKGQTRELILVREGWKTLEICSGWGSDKKGTWFLDHYSVEIVFQETLIAVVPFEVGEISIEGFTAPMLPTGPGEPLTTVKPEEEKSFEELMVDLDALIGLQSIKKKIREYTTYLDFIKLRQEKGFKDSDKISLHAVFTGNPGTGKTTVAKKLGKIYQKMGLLTKGHIHEVDRSHLVGEFIGQTAPKVKKAIETAKGGVLFIDEAYALARKGEDQKDFGKEVIEILLKELSDGTGDMAVIVAGYPDEMETFLGSNPGLNSRFNMYYEFPDYLPLELMEIADFASKNREVVLNEGARNYLYEKVIGAYRNRDRTFGNARFVNGLIDQSKMNLGLRVMKDSKPQDLPNKTLETIKADDVRRIFGGEEQRMADIPIDEDLLHESMMKLNNLIGLGKVRNEVHEIIKLVKFYREKGKNVMNAFYLHTVFMGNPGTGKTTVARILAEVYKALGILERGHIVEVDRQGLVAGYLGQTAQKTAKKVDEAIGGVLFIDEAYALTSGGPQDYGNEAIETLLKRMEDERGKFVVIAAGYPENMKMFLGSNPGLKSRFDKTLNFEDYTPDELFKIAEMMLSAEELTIEEEAEKHVRDYFTFLHANKDEYFGNARTVRKVMEEAIKNQHLRLARMDPSDRTNEMLSILTVDDVKEFKQNEEALARLRNKPVGFAFGGGGNSAQQMDEE